MCVCFFCDDQIELPCHDISAATTILLSKKCIVVYSKHFIDYRIFLAVNNYTKE